MSKTENTSEQADGWKEFQSEAVRVWNALPDKGLFFALLVPWLLVFQFQGNSTFGYLDTHSLYVWLANAYNSEFTDDSHGFLIPITLPISLMTF